MYIRTQTNDLDNLSDLSANLSIIPSEWGQIDPNSPYTRTQPILDTAEALYVLHCIKQEKHCMYTQYGRGAQ